MLLLRSRMKTDKEGVGRSGSGLCPAARSGFCHLLISGLLDGLVLPSSWQFEELPLLRVLDRQLLLLTTVSDKSGS